MTLGSIYSRRHALALSLLTALPAWGAAAGPAVQPAAPPTGSLRLSTGVAKGTYASLFRDLQASCGAPGGVPMREVPSSGSAESLDRLLNNEVSVAFVQTDVLYQRAQVDDLSRIKTLVPLHAEAVHVLARHGAAGWLDRLPIIGAQRLDSVADLAQRRVAAWGGALTTAEQIRLQAQINFQLLDLGGPQAALTALRAGQVDAILAVGGAPLDWLRDADRQLRLLPFGEDLVARLKHVYRPARLSYTQLGAAGVPTVATTAILAVRSVRTPAAATPLLALRKCLIEQLPALRETVGTHPAWGQVEPEADARWPAFGKP